MGNLVLDMIRQTVIKVVLEGTFSIALDLCCNPVELDHVLGDMLIVLHGQVVELVLHISDRVVQTKVRLEFQNKLLVVFHPEWTEVRVIHEEEVRFEPLQSNTFEVGLREGDFGVVLSKCPRVTLEVELALYQENLEFAGISPVKLVWFSDFSALQGFEGVLARLLIALARFTKTTARLASSASEVSRESKLESGSSPGGSFGGSPPGTPGAPGGFWVGVCMEQGGEWKLIAGEASLLGCSSMRAPRVGDSGQAPEAEAEVACY